MNPTVDAGIDAGVTDAGRPDAGWDAGVRRTVTFVRTPHLRLPDGTEQSNANALTGATVTLSYESPSGEWFTAPAVPDLLDVRFDQVPEGPYVIEFSRPNAAKFLYVSDAPLVNVGPKIAGRRATTYTATAILSVDAGVGAVGRPPDTMGATSFTAGFVRDSTSTLRTSDTSLRALVDLTTANSPFTLAAGDDLTLVLNRSVTDAGVTVVSALMGTTVTAPAISNAQTVPMSVTLDVLPRESATVGLAGSEYAQFVPETHPMATANNQRLLLAKSFVGESLDGGGDFDGRSMTLLQVTVPNADFAAELDWGNPFASTNPPTLVRASQPATLQFTLQGQNTNRGFDALVTQRLASETTSLRPALSPPRFPLINGATAFVERNGVSTTPTLEWTQPSLGQPTQYTVVIVRVVPGSSLTQQTVASAFTPFTRFRVPPGLLTAGEHYFAVISAQHVRRNDVRQTPNRLSKNFDEATTLTSLFAP